MHASKNQNISQCQKTCSSRQFVMVLDVQCTYVYVLADPFSIEVVSVKGLIDSASRTTTQSSTYSSPSLVMYDLLL